MIDVRLTATNPEDSTLVPVPCNTRGELLTVAPVIESIPNDVEIQGDLTVTGLINGSIGVGEQGPEGPEGPAGPPGQDGADGEDGADLDLPPDPFEGALLGWQDGELAWLGGSIPIAPGTFGPFTYDSAGSYLTVPQTVDLANGVQVYMSDSSGNPVTNSGMTSKIKRVSGTNLYFTDATSLQFYKVGDEVQPQVYITSIDIENALVGVSGGNWRGTDGSGNQGDNRYHPDSDWENQTSMSASASLPIFDPESDTFIGIGPELNKGGPWWCHINLTTPIVCNSNIKLHLNPEGQLKATALFAINDGSPIYSQENPPPGYMEIPAPESGIITKISLGRQTSWLDKTALFMQRILVDDREMITAAITETIGEERFYKPQSGSGSVQACVDSTIILRADNREWISGYYVTAPEQRIALRNALTSDIRRKTN